jgi:7-cyano-7-deazaguanine synthase
MKQKCLILLSGGIDSTTLLATMRNKYDIIAINIQYGSKHNRQEFEAFLNIVSYYNIKFKSIDISSIFNLFKSTLLLNGGDIPEGHYHQKNMKDTVVPFRNGIMLSIIAGYAESHNYDYIALASHSGDHHIYPDCRPNFNSAMTKAIFYGTSNKVITTMPFENENKESIVKLGLELKVPYELTYTCYNGKDKSCGKCASCIERLEAFKNNNAIDPITYE